MNFIRNLSLPHDPQRKLPIQVKSASCAPPICQQEACEKGGEEEVQKGA